MPNSPIAGDVYFKRFRFCIKIKSAGWCRVSRESAINKLKLLKYTLGKIFKMTINISVVIMPTCILQQ